MDPQHGSLFTSKRIERLAALFLIAATAFVTIIAIDRLTDLFDAGPAATTVITVEGTGTAAAVPNIAMISFTVLGEGKTASLAQDEATKKNNVALALLAQKGVEEKDIKTTSYNLSPKYSFPQPCYAPPCIYDEQRLVGYEVRQTTEVKVRDLAQVGELLSMLGDSGASELYGPNFTVEDEDAVRAEARKEAITEARAKAKLLARDLGVRLVRVVSFNENAGPYPMPFYGRGGLMMNEAVKATPDVAPGENEFSSTVSITYEIR
ncbi:SIMPL domain-containing protein [Patescibacteria group bacterium]|nr:SIMPL domain-containing protein [Patescibacteria group bacterium]